MSDPVTVVPITLQVHGDGTALSLEVGVGTFGLTKVEIQDAKPGMTLDYTPDVDNAGNTTFWVRRIPGVDGALPSGTVTLLLYYPAE